ncbi:MAG: PAS domain-containing sensor histidine kinase [Sphingomonadales bacterium]
MDLGVVILTGGLLVLGGFVLAFAAVLNRAQAERRRQIAEAQAALYRMLAAASRDAFIVIGPDDQISVSERAREWLQLSRPPKTVDGLAPDGAGGGFTADGYAQLTKLLVAARQHGFAEATHLELAGGARRVAIKLHAQGSGQKHPPNVLVWLEREDAADGSGLGAPSRALQIINAAPLPIWLHDGQGALRFVNQAYIDAVEAADLKAVVENDLELIANPRGSSMRQIALKVLAEAKPHTRIEHTVIAGARRALQITQHPLATSNGEATPGVAGFAIDITEAEQAQNDVARFSEANAETMNRLSTPVAIFGQDKQLVFFNSAFASMSQLDPDYLAARPHHGELLEMMRDNRRVPEQSDFPAWKKAVLHQYVTLIEPEEDMWHLADDTTWRVVTQPHPQGGLLVLFEDVTDKLALMRSHDTLIKVQQATLNNLQEGVAVFGADGQLQLSNDGFARMWQVPADWLAGAPHVRDLVERCAPLLIRRQDGEALSEAVVSATIARKPAADRLVLNDERVVDYAAVPLPDGAALLTFSDVTDSFRIERALRDRNEALETADRLKSEFVANMSYELRTPLTSISGFAEMLDREYFGPLNDKQKAYIQDILTSSAKLQVLINDILDLAVTEAGAIALEKSAVPVQALIESAIALTSEQARAKQISLEAKITKRCGSVFGDERRLKQVLYNLIVNAIHFTPEGGRVEISARRDGDMLELSVADNGVGIRAEEQAQVFERFQRGSNAAQGKGAGLGLALVRSFIELHGGTVRLASELGKGTTVVCVLPCRDTNREVAGDASAPTGAVL